MTTHKPIDVTQRNTCSCMIAWEEGTLGDDSTIALFQTLIDSGVVWQLQGCYGRTAERLIEAGLCTPPAQSRSQPSPEVADGRACSGCGRSIPNSAVGTLCASCRAAEDAFTVTRL